MFVHEPVLFSEVRSLFLESQQTVVIDATLGLGGHASMLVSLMEPGSTFIGFDRDIENLDVSKSRIIVPDGVSCFLEHRSFEAIETILAEHNLSEIDFILYDLGVSSAHYDDTARGFSVRGDAPLDMRFDRTGGKTAHDLIMSLDESELRRIFYVYADEKKAPYIARAIVETRSQRSIDTTAELRAIIEDASFDPKSTIRVFQALRIAVNDEFGHIERSLHEAISRLSLGGRIAVITFHSIEDRLVKTLLTPYLTSIPDEITGQVKIPARLKKVTKKPIEPTPLEIEKNPRSRSAKLRIVERVS